MKKIDVYELKACFFIGNIDFLSFLSGLIQCFYILNKYQIDDKYFCKLA